jgi:glycosyltransferase involved in cell wall biosynthesis
MPIEVVTDATVIQEYYATVLARDTRCIAYGTVLYDRGHGIARLPDMGLEPDRYLLYVSRLEPENNALLVVQAYANLETELPLVIVGDAPYAREYIASVRAAADRRVRFLGYRFGDDYHALQANARIYIQATEVGGTHPALVEALGHRNAIVAHDVPEHREVLGDAARYFAFLDPYDLTRVMRTLLDDEAAVLEHRNLAAARVLEHYSWDTVADAYEDLFSALRAARR